MPSEPRQHVRRGHRHREPQAGRSRENDLRVPDMYQPTHEFDRLIDRLFRFATDRQIAGAELLAELGRVLRANVEVDRFSACTLILAVVVMSGGRRRGGGIAWCCISLLLTDNFRSGFSCCCCCHHGYFGRRRYHCSVSSIRSFSSSCLASPLLVHIVQGAFNAPLPSSVLRTQSVCHLRKTQSKDKQVDKKTASAKTNMPSLTELQSTTETRNM